MSSELQRIWDSAIPIESPDETDFGIKNSIKMADIVKPKGMITFAPNEKAPDFVLGTIAISLNQLNEWVKGDGAQYVTDYKGEPQIKLQVTSMKGKRGILLAVDTWRPGEKKEDRPERNQANPTYEKGTTTRDGVTTEDDDNLPFSLLALIGMSSFLSMIVV